MNDEGGSVYRPGSGLLLERPASSGGSGLEARVRELWIRLAQMEAEKVKVFEPISFYMSFSRANKDYVRSATR
jgi:hypothetical protein